MDNLIIQVVEETNRALKDRDIVVEADDSSWTGDPEKIPGWAIVQRERELPAENGTPRSIEISYRLEIRSPPAERDARGWQPGDAPAEVFKALGAFLAAGKVG